MVFRLGFLISALLVSGTLPAGGLAPVLQEIQAAPANGVEFIEIHNPGQVRADLGGARLYGAVDYTFPAGARIEPGGFLVLAGDPRAFEAAYGFAPGGRFQGSLADEGGALALESRDGSFLTRAVYEIPESSPAREGGASLELPSVAADSGWPPSWLPSLQLGGTPGRANSRSMDARSSALVARESVWRYFKGRTEPEGAPLAWASPGYDDSSWAEGKVPIGYGNADEATILDDMKSSYSTVYIRRIFERRGGEAVLELVLWTVFDDGFVAYLNGKEVARRNLGERGAPVAHDAVATARQTAEGLAEEIRLGDARNLLREGENVLAIHAANEFLRSTDFAIDAALTVVTGASALLASPPLRWNEAWTEGAVAQLELINGSPDEFNLASFRIVAGTDDLLFNPAGVRVPGGGRLTVAVPAPFLERKLALVDPSGLLGDTLAFPPALPGGSSGRFPDGEGEAQLLAGRTLGSANSPPAQPQVVISEIHYHPTDADAEFIEVLAQDDMNLAGWTLSGAVRYRFPAGSDLMVGERAAIARDPDRIAPADPGAKIWGPYSGRLANDAEEILLRDPEGRPIQRIRYADDGAWPVAADGNGASLELMHPALSTSAAAAWGASRVAGGTPGARNSVEAAAPPPTIAWARHEPLVPTPGDAVRVTARIEPDPAGAELLWRLDGEPEYRRLPMFASAGLRMATIPAQAQGAIVEYAVEARLAGPEVARYPAGQPGSALYQVDERVEPIVQPTYRLIFRTRDLEALLADVDSNEVRPVTLVAKGKAFHRAQIRYRGHGSRLVEPKSYRVRLTNEEPLDGETELLLNGYRPERQILGMDLWRRAGLPYSRAESVVLVFQGQIYPRYGAVEPIESRYLERHFGDASGNLYRGQRTADLSYLGESQALYANRYEKHTNALEHDWTDVVALTRAFALSSDAEFPAAVAEHIDVEEWIRWFAVSTVLGNQEGGLHRDTGDDYYMYRPAGGKFVLLPWDMDSTFQEPEEPIFRPSLPAVRRFLTHPAFAPLYFRALEDLLERAFTPEAIARQASRIQAFGDDTIDDLVTYTRSRSAFVRRSVPIELSCSIVSGGWGTGDVLYAEGDAVVLGGWAPASRAARVIVNGVPAAFVPWKATWRADLTLAGLETLVRVEARDAAGALLVEATAVVRKIGGGHVVTSLPGGDVDWSGAGSPYILAAELEVAAGTTLRVGPATRILTLPSAGLIVRGRLEVVGEPSRRVEFEAGAGSGEWNGIILEAGASARIERCDFSDGGSSIGLPAPGKPFIQARGGDLEVVECTFRGGARVAVEVIEGSARVQSCRFFETLEAIHGVLSVVEASDNLIESTQGDSDGIDLDGDASGQQGSVLADNTILDVGDDGIDLLDSSATVSGNFVIDASDRGISVEGPGTPRIEGNVVSGCSTGLALKDGTTAAGSRNTVTTCGVGVWAFIKTSGAAAASGDLHSSIIWGNGVDIIVDSGSRLAIDHSDVGGDSARWGESNLSASPRFMGERDFRLAPSSPCKSAGRGGQPAGARGLAGGDPPTITSVEPASGPLAGGNIVEIRGTGLEGVLDARIGGRPLASVRFLPRGSIVAVAPAADRAGPASIEIVTAGGYVAAPDLYRYAVGVRRGDVNGDARLDVSDPVAILLHLFAGGAEPVCADAADTNVDGRLALDDVILLLKYLFNSGPPPQEILADCP